jgi:hypothetical protein
MSLSQEGRARRTWATLQIENLKKQREILDSRIREIERFVALLDQSEDAVRSGIGEVQLTTPATVHPNGSGPKLADSIVDALEPSGASGLKANRVVAAVLASGFRSESKYPDKTVVIRELYRMARLKRRGVKRVGRGRFAVVKSPD